MIQKNTNSKKNNGFTIVELLVVIVVIGILAAITIVSYTGVTSKATASANKSNAASVMKAAEAVFAENGAYPATSATATTVTAALSAASAKVPSSIYVSNTNPSAGANAGRISYRLKGTGDAGICVGYWDPTVGSGAIQYMFGGAATADNGTTCS